MRIEGKRERLEVEGADTSGSRYHDSNLAGSIFDGVNFFRAAISRANLAGVVIDDSFMPGSRIHNTSLIGAGFDDVNLTHAVIENANLAGLHVRNCKLDGMRIDGIAVADLLAAYRVRE